MTDAHTDEHFLYVDSGAINLDHGWNDPQLARSAYWFLVPADGNDGEALTSLLRAADEWAASPGSVYASHQADAMRELLESIRNHVDGHTA